MLAALLLFISFSLLLLLLLFFSPFLLFLSPSAITVAAFLSSCSWHTAFFLLLSLSPEPRALERHAGVSSEPIQLFEANPDISSSGILPCLYLFF